MRSEVNDTSTVTTDGKWGGRLDGVAPGLLVPDRASHQRDIGHGRALPVNINVRILSRGTALNIRIHDAEGCSPAAAR